MPPILAYGLGILSGVCITVILAVVFYVLAATRGDETEYLPPHLDDALQTE